MSKRLLAVIGVILIVFVGIFLIFKPSGKIGQSQPTPTAIPATDIASKDFQNLSFVIDFPAITDSADLVFATDRNTALATAKPEGTGFKPLTPQSFLSLDWVAWSPNGKHAVVKTPRNRTVLYTEGSALQELSPKISSAEWSPDSSLFVYGFGSELSVQIFDTNTGQYRTLKGLKGERFAWSPDGKQLAVIDKTRDSKGSGKLSVGDVAAGEFKDLEKDSIISASWSPDGSKLLVTRMDSDPGLQLITISSGQIKDINLGGLATNAVWTSNNEVLLAAPLEASVGYLEGTDSAADRLWRVSLIDGRIFQLTEFDQRVRAIRLFEKRLLVVTNTRTYDVKLK